MTDQQRGASLYTAGQPVTTCTNPAQLYGWLQAANDAWRSQHRASLTDHERLCEAVSLAVQEERTKRILCVGHVEPETREIVIVSEAEAMDEALEIVRQQSVVSQEWYAAVESEQVGQDFCERPFLY